MLLTTILWDMGGVVCNFNQGTANERLSKRSRSGKSVKEVSDILFGSSAASGQYNEGLTEDFYLGREGSESFYHRVKSALELDMSYKDFVRAWGDIFTPNDDIIRFIKDVHESGYVQGVLSSTNPIHWEYMDRLAKIEGVLGKDKIICTYHPDAGFKKPSAELFQTAVNRLQVPKERVIYVDDVRAYTEVALRLGFGAAVHVDHNNEDYQARCIAAIRELGIS